MNIPGLDIPLSSDICFFDLETTGLNVVKDRIVQIAVVRYYKDGRAPLEYSTLINPGIPISLESIAIHGITPADVSNKPTFAELSEKIWSIFENADLGGYNSTRFDIPMLMEEFARVGKEFVLDGRNNIDVQRIFYKMEPRTLKAALKFYCGEELENAHDALSDVKATIQVFNGQLQKYEGQPVEDEDGVALLSPISKDIKAIHTFLDDLKTIDGTQKLKYNQKDEVVFNFGKHLDKPVGKACYEDRNFYTWILEKDFTHQVKTIVKREFKNYEKQFIRK